MTNKKITQPAIPPSAFAAIRVAYEAALVTARDVHDASIIAAIDTADAAYEALCNRKTEGI